MQPQDLNLVGDIALEFIGFRQTCDDSSARGAGIELIHPGGQAGGIGFAAEHVAEQLLDVLRVVQRAIVLQELRTAG